MITVARQLYSIGKGVMDTSLQFICKVACRSQLIDGCSITLNVTNTQ